MKPIAKKIQHGVSLVLAIFVLVVMSLLGAAMMNVLSSGTESVAREVISTRALLAAHSGAQALLADIFPAGGSVVTAQCAGAENSVETHARTLSGLFACNDVSVDCKYVTIDTVNYFTVTSTGSCGTAEPAVRIVEVQARSD